MPFLDSSSVPFSLSHNSLASEKDGGTYKKLTYSAIFALLYINIVAGKEMNLHSEEFPAKKKFQYRHD